MRNFIIFILAHTLKLILSLRYRITVKGYDLLKDDNVIKPGVGTLFLPNHPAAVIDPSAVTLAVYPKFIIRPIIVEYMYYTPFIYGVMKFLNALPVPNFETSTNSIKRKRHDRVLTEVVKGLKKGENFLIYPAGRLKHTHIEKIAGASATHKIIQESPGINIVLVKVKGLWGSSFSRALTGKVPPLGPTLKKGLIILLKNFIFFTPRRDVIVELVPAPADFPYRGSRLEINQWLENWYNQPDGLEAIGPESKSESDLESESEFNVESELEDKSALESSAPSYSLSKSKSHRMKGESLRLISYSLWKNEIPEIYKKSDQKDQWISLKEIPEDVQQKVLKKIEELTEIKPEDINPKMTLSADLGMDSLDISEMAMFIQDKFDTNPIPVTELTTIDRVLGIAAKKIKIEEKVEEGVTDLAKWLAPREHSRALIAPGKIMPEVFLNICQKMGPSAAYADARSGVLTFSRLKLAVILFAEHIRHLPGQYVGIMLPAAPAAFISVLACQLAGKTPLMINWTIGTSHTDAVQKLSGVEVVLTSWAFLERLDAVDLGSLDEKLMMLETVRLEFSIFDKLRAVFRSKLSNHKILKIFGADKIKENDPAVLLFTSGTESLPKGVPLSHKNILSNQRSALSVVDIYNDDIVFSFLPPFHSFGFCVTGLMGLFCGARTAFYPNPTDGKGLAKACETWKATVVCGAPTFIKAMLKAATSEQVKSLRICVTGAEKTPPEVFELLEQHGKDGIHVEGYGITECSPILTATRSNEPKVGVGRPIPDVELLLVHHETFVPVPVGNEGLVLARGPNIFSGYINPDLAPPFVTVNGKEWYNTGDMGFLDNDGNLTISGRKKRFIKIGGEMISLLAIEHALLDSVKQKGWSIAEEGTTLAIIAKEYPGAKPEICLVTTLDISHEQANEAIREAGLSTLIRITEVKKVDEIPLMGTGKTNYRILEEQWLGAKNC